MPVYFIRASDSGAVKIGFARDIGKRQKTLQASTPEKLNLIRQVEGDHKVEAWFHRYFAIARLHGEWFDYTGDMLVVEPPVLVEPRQNKTGPKRELSKLLSKLLCDLRPSGQTPGEWKKTLAKVCGVSAGTIWNWQRGKTSPSALHGLRLMAHLGEPFAGPLLALVGLRLTLEPSEAEQELQALRDEISRLAIAAGNGGLRAVPNEGTVKS